MSHPAVAARRRRIANIRRLVVAISIATFIAVFAGLYVQMAAGRDPVLGSQTTATASSGSSSGGSSATSSDSGAGGPAAVTTSQS